MNGWDDLDGVTQPPIPEGNDELDAVLHALQSPATPAELSGMNDMVAAFQAAVLVAPSAPTPARKPIMIKKLLTGKALAAIGAVTLISATAAAAAGVVPSPFSAARPTLTAPAKTTINATATSETATSETDKVDTKSTDTESTDTESTDTATTETATTETAETAETADRAEQRPDVNGPAKFGLCTAYAAQTKHETGTIPTSGLPVPFQALADAATAAGKTVAEFCADTTPGHSGGTPGHSGTAPGNKGHGPSSTAPDQNDQSPSANTPGKPDNTPSATTPGNADDNPSATAPGRTHKDPPVATTPLPHDESSTSAPTVDSHDNGSSNHGQSGDHGNKHGSTP